MSEPRIIKKYPNRRLYDTAISSYITLEDVRRLVLEHASFQVRDARSNEDITRGILLQIIIEQEADGEPIFSVNVLEQIIRLYGDTMQGMVTNWFERSLKLFREQQETVREQMQTVMTGDPVSFMRGITEQNLNMWKEMQERFMRAGTTTTSTSSPKSPPTKSPESSPTASPTTPPTSSPTTASTTSPTTSPTSSPTASPTPSTADTAGEGEKHKEPPVDPTS